MILQWLKRWRGKRGVSEPAGVGVSASGVAPRAQSPALARQWMDVAALMAINSLELRVRRLVQGVHRGIHRSVRRGYSAEFTEYRPYTPGDDLRHLDWRRMARTDRPFLRQYEEESDWGCLVIMDLSASMAYGSLPHSKADYGRTLAGTLGAFLHGQGDPVGLLRFAGALGELVPVRHTPKQMARWWGLLAAEPAGEGTALGFSLQEALRLLKRPSLVVVVSDLLAPPETWAEPLRQLRASRQEVVFFEVLDPQELEFQFEGDTRFADLESDHRLDLDATRARAGYLEKLSGHRKAVAAQCAEHSAMLLEARTDAPLEPILREALAAIARRRPMSGARFSGG